MRIKESAKNLLVGLACLFFYSACAQVGNNDSSKSNAGNNAPDGKNEAAYNVATFDSGFGGYFTAKEIEKQSRSLSKNGYGPFSITHYGDTLNAPYGEKTTEQIAKFTSEGVLTAFHDGAEDVYIACNTASTQYERVKEIIRAENPAYENHVFSIINVSVDEVMKTVNKKLALQNNVNIAIFATPATVKSENYPKFLAKALNTDFKPGILKKITQPRWLKKKGATIDSYAYVAEFPLSSGKKVSVYQMAPANWVDMIENGASDSEKRFNVENDIKTLTSQINTDAVFDVVGEFCTHYPVFDSIIQSELKGSHKVTTEAPFVVQGPLMGSLFNKTYLQSQPWKNDNEVSPPNTPSIYLTGDNISSFMELVKKIFPNDPEPAIAKKEFVSLN
ncbi:MAG: aspartate/glutamate racemase family protein [Oligoflexales bacterium]|nr:aspartate/glutamate racemase family protein [Oligoflexales bacterium]